MYDAIIVGARCAGSPTAMLLARRGYRVLLLDKATFPSDAISTHFIHHAGVARLKRWGLLERLRATDCPPISKYKVDLGHFTLEGSPPPAEGGVREAYAPRRKVLDKILVDAARDAGAEVREGFTVREVIREGGRVVGVRGDDAVERAHVVVGADGIHSIVARSVRAESYDERPALTCAYYTYWSNVPMDGVELYPRDGRMIVAFPTNDALTLVIVLWPCGEFQEVRGGIEESYMKAVALAPSLAERLRAGRREERFYGTAETPNFFRKPYGPGWALVGDAGYHKDPITAQGITDGFRDAELLAQALDAGLTGSRPIEEALADYERRRNEAAAPIYEQTCMRASLQPPPPEAVQFFLALRGNQEQIDRFFGVDAGTVAVADFFSPENVGRIMSRAQGAAPQA